MKLARLIFGAALGAAALNASAAGTATTTLAVSATVASACSVTASALGFGAYDPTSAVLKPGTATLTVTCTLGALYTIGLDAGGGSGATTAVRKMTAGGTTLDYKLCQDVGCVANWGNTVSTDTVAGVGTGLGIPSVVFGQIAALQNVGAGTYNDTVNVSVNY